MLTNKLTQKNYITFGNVYQLKLPLNIECIIPKDDSVRLLGQIVEEMNLKEIYQSYSRFRNNQATPKVAQIILCKLIFQTSKKYKLMYGLKYKTAIKFP